MCLTETRKYTVFFKFGNTKGCPLQKNTLHISALGFYIYFVTWCNSNKIKTKYPPKKLGFMAKGIFCKLVFTVEPTKQVPAFRVYLLILCIRQILVS